MARILALGGDGIGPEILDQGLRVAAFLNNAAGLDLEVEPGRDHAHGGAAHMHDSYVFKLIDAYINVYKPIHACISPYNLIQT